MMSVETARAAIDRLLSPKGTVAVGFFGGEPILNWDMIVAVTADVTELSAKCGVGWRLHVTTNATLLDEEKVRFLDENGFSLIVSLDGRGRIPITLPVGPQGVRVAGQLRIVAVIGRDGGRALDAGQTPSG